MHGFQERGPREVHLPRPRLTAEDIAHLERLETLGFSQVKRGDHYEIINNRSLANVDPGPYTYQEALKKCDQMNAKVKAKEIEILTGYKQ